MNWTVDPSEYVSHLVYSGRMMPANGSPWACHRDRISVPVSRLRPRFTYHKLVPSLSVLKLSAWIITVRPVSSRKT